MFYTAHARSFDKYMSTVIVDKEPTASSSSVYGISFFFGKKKFMELRRACPSILRANVMPY